ncbi:MAG: hypothetical protein WCS52_16640 [bacterium]
MTGPGSGMGVPDTGADGAAPSIDAGSGGGSSTAFTVVAAATTGCGMWVDADVPAASAPRMTLTETHAAGTSAST